LYGGMISAPTIVIVPRLSCLANAFARARAADAASDNQVIAPDHLEKIGR